LQDEQQQQQDEHEDSDGWMEAQGVVVEQELAKRQAEMEGGPQGHTKAKSGKSKGKKGAEGCVQAS